MRACLQEYGMFIIYFIIGVALVSVMFGSTLNSDMMKTAVSPEEKELEVSVGDNAVIAARPKPELEVVNGALFTGSEWKGEESAREYISKAKLHGSTGELEDVDDVEIRLADKVDTSRPGEYVVKYVLEDPDSGMKAKAEAQIVVDAP